MRFTRVRKVEEADGGALNITLFRREGLVRGWFVGPPRTQDGCVDIPYAAKSASLIAPVAIVRAHHIARARQLEICIIDPDDLWDEAWVNLK